MKLSKQGCASCKGTREIKAYSTVTIRRIKRTVIRRVACPCTYADQFNTRRLRIPLSESKP